MISSDNEFEKPWDAVVIGAGPGGSTAAIQLARTGARVLLVERAKFPRAKVCGCCLSGKAVRNLEALGLQHVLADSIALRSFVLGAGGQQVDLTVSGGRAISRNRLDSQLVDAAVAAGVTLAEETTATLGPVDREFRQVQLQRHTGGQREPDVVFAKVVLVCSGLANGLLKQTVAINETVLPNSLIGLTAILPAQTDFQPGVIWMAVNADGYLGITVIEDGRLNISAAVKKSAVKAAGGPTQLAQQILQDSGLPSPDGWDQADWMGTRELTRQLETPAAERLFVVGDAAGYVEPFTGQGMSWAIGAATLVQPWAQKAIQNWQPDLVSGWAAQYHQSMQSSQRTCKWVAWFSSRPRLVRSTIPVLRYLPSLAGPFVKSIHGQTIHGRALSDDALKYDTQDQQSA